MLHRMLARLRKPAPPPDPDSHTPRRLSAREQRQRDGHATQARLSARYAALLETADHIWELRKAEQRREEIYAIVEELLADADEELRAYAQRRMARGREKRDDQPDYARRFRAWRGWRRPPT